MKKEKENDIQFQPDFYIIPKDVMINPDLQPLDAKVYGVVYWLDRMNPVDDRGCFASNATIAKIVGSSASGVANSLVRLKNAGFIAIQMTEDNHRQGIKVLTYMSTNNNPYSNEEGTLTQTSNRISNNKKIYTSETEAQQISDLHRGYVKLYKLDLDALQYATVEEKQAALDSALKLYKLTDKRKQKALARLRDCGYDMCKRAILNASKDEWTKGNNDRKWFLDLYEYLFRSYENVEKWANKNNGGIE